LFLIRVMKVEGEETLQKETLHWDGIVQEKLFIILQKPYGSDFAWLPTVLGQSTS
jgi:hypothetical protein